MAALQLDANSVRLFSRRFDSLLLIQLQVGGETWFGTFNFEC